MKTVRHILKTKGGEVHSIAPTAKVLEALLKMAEWDVGALMVLNQQGDICGIFSEREYARKVFIKGKSSRDLAVEEVMADHVHRVPPTESLESCLKTMTEARTRHLAVLEDGQLVGIISMGDVVKSLIEAKQVEIEQLHSYITGTP